MVHKCEIKSKRDSLLYVGERPNCVKRLRRKILQLVMISSDNPLSTYYFRSEIAIRDERKRQLTSSWKYVIHPLSKFRAWYELYISIVYFLALISKPIDMGFSRRETTIFPGHRICTTVIDLLCFVDIILHFFTGYEKHRKIELRLSRISWHYIKSPSFFSDLVSSCPRNAIIFFHPHPSSILLGILDIFALFKIIRLHTLVKYVYNVTAYFKFKIQGALFLASSIMVTLMVIHWIACLQYGVPRLVRRYFSEKRTYDSWIYKNDLYTKTFLVKYTHCFFQASAFILSIRIKFYQFTLVEEFLMATITYILGKILIVTIWVILAVQILDSRSMQIKFYEVINQLDEYMKQREIPFSLREMISQYYTFKYQNKYFKEEMITGLISGSLRNEVNMHVCRSLILNVSIFSDLSQDQMNEVVQKLVPQIFMPKDTIMQSGGAANDMYFLASGTVAVYTHSGKEICHLQDGAYFGEVSLVMKNQPRLVTVIAIEISQVYKLSRRSFEKFLGKNKKVMRKIVQLAEVRFKEVAHEEALYKKKLMEKWLHKNKEEED